MDIPRRDFIPRFKLMETRWHPIRTDKAERPRCRSCAPIILPLPPPGQSTPLHPVQPPTISPRFHRTIHVGLSDYAFLLIRASILRSLRGGISIVKKRNLKNFVVIYIYILLENGGYNRRFVDKIV